MIPCSSLSFSLGLLFCVFCPICRGRWWPGCRQPWQMAVCVSACVCFLLLFFPQRSLSQARSIQRHCLTTAFNPMGGGTHRVGVWGVWLVWVCKSHSNASDAQWQSAWNTSKMNHPTTTLPSYTARLHLCMCDLEQQTAKQWARASDGSSPIEILYGLLHSFQPLHLRDKCVPVSDMFIFWM